MKIVPCYKNRIINLPAETVLPELSTATREELAVLIAVTASPEFDVSALAVKLNITEAMLLSAVSHWTRRGVISVTESKESCASAAPRASARASGEGAAVNTNVKRTSALAHSTVPHYTSDETARYLEENPSFTALVDSCQMILGKVFSVAEITILIGMADHLGLSAEYIMLLFAHAKNLGKDSVRYIEKMALSLFDKGIVTYPELIDEVARKEASASMEAFVRKLFGIGRRALIDSEKTMIDRWTNEYAMDRDMIRHAYEITVAKTTEPSFPYMNAVIENWHKAGYADMEAITRAEEAYKRDKDAKEGKDPMKSSFDTDEFFEAALRRSYESHPKAGK